MLRGTPEETLDGARRLLAGVSEVIWADRRLHRQLGGSCSAVVLDGHGGVDLDQLGIAHGLVRDGGSLVLRLPPRLAGRAGARLEALLPSAPSGPVREAPPIAHGSAEQAALVASLVAALDGDAHLVLTAPRGRGKSAAIGLALAGRHDAVVVSDDPRQAATLRQFAPHVPWQAPDALEPRRWAVVEEAAALPVPLLRRWVEAHPDSRFVFVTTTHGYEGHGRGFALRLLPWLRQREVRELSLSTPIRWGPDDALERWVDRLLVLDAEPRAVPGTLTAERWSQDRLAGDEAGLRQVFGLLVEAHYRTTPRDLQVLLDAPDLHLHVLAGQGVAGVCQVVGEGALTEAEVAQVDRGERLRAQALAEWLVVEGEPALARLPLLRSVRTTVHPARRGEGLGRRLVAHVHEQHAPACFGTLFGLTLPLLRWRRSLGYRLVGLSWGRSGRSGEPSAVMLRASSALAEEAIGRLRARLARDLGLWLALQQAQQRLDPALVAALEEDLPEPASLDVDDRLAAYRAGRRTLEWAGTAWLAALPDVEEPARGVLIARLVQHRPWRAIAAERNTTVPALMRKLRRDLGAG